MKEGQSVKEGQGVKEGQDVKGMQYVSTRGGGKRVTALEAIALGLADDGGLYVPEALPVLPEGFLDKLSELSYEDIATEIFHAFIPEVEKEELKKIAISSAERFFENEPAPVFKVSDELYILELWHGPTLAFKDIALTVLPRLMKLAKERLGIKTNTLILAATSGDTGAATLEGFKDLEGFKALTFYPFNNVSRLQKLQMQTAKGENVSAVGIDGNFDDAQTAVKNLFSDKDFRKKLLENGYDLSSANSINLGRLIPQIVYYFSTYAMLLDSEQIKAGEKINFAVPSGNFGDILAGYYAYKMGLNIQKLICASNSNCVLTDFFETGGYNADRVLQKTISPSMDILVSSNLERLIFDLTGKDRTKELFESLKKTKRFKLTKDEHDALREIFYGDYCSDEETKEAIANFFESEDYVADPHTAVALACNSNYIAETGDEAKSVIVSTASPYKFAPDVLDALEEQPKKDLGDCLEQLCELSALNIPDALVESLSGKLRFSSVIEAKNAPIEVLRFLKIDN